MIKNLQGHFQRAFSVAHRIAPNSASNRFRAMIHFQS